MEATTTCTTRALIRRWRAASPGLVVLTAMIEHLIESRHGVFDFLKGEEDYKLRLGATGRPLFLVEAEVGK